MKRLIFFSIVTVLKINKKNQVKVEEPVVEATPVENKTEEAAV